MDEEQELLAMPNYLQITSETTQLGVEPRPAGDGGELVLRLAVTEYHTWHGIGGRTGRVRRPRRLTWELCQALDDNPSSSSGAGGPDCLPSGDDDCRRLIGRMIQDTLREEEEYRYLTAADWDRAVPLGVERDLAVAGAHRGGGATFKAVVDISVHFEFFYCEARELFLACHMYDGGDLPGRIGNGGDGEATSCSICLEEMSPGADEVTNLLGCPHGFHGWCIAKWLHKASTCPVCRRDQLQYLPPAYQDLHGVMTLDDDPDSSPDF